MVNIIVSILIGLLFVALFFDVVWIGFAFTRNDTRAGSFALLCAAHTFYALGNILEILSTTVGEVSFALRIENVGIPMLAPFFLLTAITFFQPRMRRPWMPIACVVYGFTVWLIVFFNDYHHLYYTSITLDYNGHFYALALGKGPLYYVRQTICTSCWLLGYALLGMRMFTSSRKLRGQLYLFVIGAFIGFSSNIIAHLFGIVPFGIDPVPFTSAIALVFFAITLFRHKLIDIVPTAFNMAAETMDDAMIVLDTDWGYVYCNRTAGTLFPYLKKLLGTEEVLKLPEWPKELTPAAGNQATFSITHPETGATILQRANIRPIVSRRGRAFGVLLVIRDITEITDMLNRLNELAITDPLTGVFNRRHFMTLVERQLATSVRHNLPFSILLLDIDLFKNINDTYGHLAGDHILCQIISTLTAQMRANDVIARYGGEEFMILSVENDPGNLMAFAERLRLSLQNAQFTFDDTVIPVTASFGAVLIQPGQTFREAMEAADKALYTAKNSGRNMSALGEINATHNR